ncbi:MAG: hypothetical protein A2729_03995 [Candidatus Buchananbacteria bacterium RIFCSPHIGHO2_01_FULL_39_14]|uniref:Glycosyl transferase family 1 domain-containing protein n=2 Tax=Candidatus Buchananiibacteriota TaxID=1817903 RepID=A0A1G1YUL6_9BACT|nr:MAG: hypothetical protein A2729_03995 [Candidatus Buchananbacteria bacterium RIFCSPHIGHO2_01_FULL_39_14]OGY48630.1 MAG: hypothetical protein A3D39_05190 [Candidatus Buchananbacteria bacterium RIFCSPHIGHO2_02_FULL_39_17]OGY56055.1 MAG: hypothetical protein A2912_03570 [Candidatus Buchananbacteria bacterium RIFCSPLOWO2_01_FULL_40_23b]
MRILIFSLAYLPFIGGAELAVKEITDRISGISAKGGPQPKADAPLAQASDWEFDLITVNLDGKQKSVEKVGNVMVYRLGRGRMAKYFFSWQAVKKAQELNRQKNYQSIWAIMANQAGLAALFFKKEFPQVKYVLTLQEGDSLKRIWSRTLLIRSLYKKIYQKADAITAISNFLAKRAKKYGYQGQLSIVPNGVDLSNFKKEFELEEINGLKKQLGLESSDKVITTISRLVYKNGIDILIKAVKDLPVKVLIIGSGKLETRLNSLAQELGVRNKILFLGYIGQNNLSQYLQLTDVFVRTSRSEGLGSAFLEAMAAGVPVIGTCVGGIPDFLKDGQTGLFVEVGNPIDLAAKIKILLTDEALRQRLINNARSLVFQSYDWQQIAQKMAGIFES